MKFRRFFAGVLLLLFTLAAGAQAPDTLRILSIGNSFSVDAVEQNLYEIAADAGAVYIIGNMYIGGCSLERHAYNAESGAAAYSYRKVGADGVRTVRDHTALPYALADEKWDVVSFQQSSPLSGNPYSYEPWLTRLIAYVKARVPSASRYLFHQTWAYAKDALNPNFPNYGCDQAVMYASIMEASRWAAESHALEIVPCGTAIQNYRATWYRDNATRDGYHLNLVGRYTAAATWYCVLSGKDVRGNAYRPEHLTEGQVKAAQAAAAAAAESPYEVTDFGMRTNDVNYEEALIPAYRLPEMLRCADGTKVQGKARWEEKRRAELYALFEREMFGRAPAAPPSLHTELLESATGVLGGLADRRQVRIHFAKNRYMDLLIYTPAGAEKPVPAFLGINFHGNHSITDDEGVLMTEQDALQRRYGVYPGLDRNKGESRAARGAQASRWPLELILSAGYGVVTFYRGDVDPDFDDGFRNGVHGVYYREGQHYPKPDEWGSIAAWAWGLSRALDYLEKDPSVDASRVAVLGHSRLGKTALWAGASDARFALVISNDSGCCGAALSRRGIGETVEIINRSFPHWFCANFKKYGGNEDKLPFDQHELLALIAPRPLYVASASADQWADPKGEFLAAVEASKVWQLYGYRGLKGVKMPEAGGAVSAGRIAYHLREGKHDITAFDWQHYIDFADKFLK